MHNHRSRRAQKRRCTEDQVYRSTELRNNRVAKQRVDDGADIHLEDKGLSGSIATCTRQQPIAGMRCHLPLSLWERDGVRGLCDYFAS
jgi:hypothetical protein